MRTILFATAISALAILPGMSLAESHAAAAQDNPAGDTAASTAEKTETSPAMAAMMQAMLDGDIATAMEAAKDLTDDEKAAMQKMMMTMMGDAHRGGMGGKMGGKDGKMGQAGGGAHGDAKGGQMNQAGSEKPNGQAGMAGHSDVTAGMKEKPAASGGHGGMKTEGAMTGMASESSMEGKPEGKTTMGLVSTGNADADFIRDMTVHHRGAVEMSRTILDKGGDEEVLELAKRTVDKQTEEISWMENWLTENGYEVPE